MFLSFFESYNVRNCDACYLWWFYNQLYKMKDIAFIIGENYLHPPAFYKNFECWDIEGHEKYFNLKIPDINKLDNIKKYLVSADIYKELIDNFKNLNHVEKYLLENEFEPLENELDKIISNILKTDKIEALLTIKNSPSLNKIAKKYDLKVLHYEQAAFRPDNYAFMAYMDFKGVNGDTECSERYLKFQEELDNINNINNKKASKPLILSRNEILSLIAEYKAFEAIFDILGDSVEEKLKTFEIGLPLQVENDSNLLSFANNYTNFDSICLANRFYKKEQILLRKHPLGLMDYSDRLGIKDSSETVIKFIKSCKRIMTINSSVAIEAVLLNKPAFILGDTPFKFLSQKFENLEALNDFLSQTTKNDLEKLNFAIFGYMIPFELLTDEKYIRWRLSAPPEIEIYNYHLNFYLKKLEEKLEKGQEFNLDINTRTIEEIKSIKAALNERFENIMKMTEYVKTKEKETNDKVENLQQEIESLKTANKYLNMALDFKNDSALKNLFEKFKLENKNKKICFYGAGIWAKAFINSFDLSELNIQGFIDKNPDKYGLKIESYLIYKPADLITLNPEVLVIMVQESDKVLPCIKELKEKHELNFEIFDNSFILISK